jgi:RNA polymerase sigma-70 factor, ECF subfamily
MSELDPVRAAELVGRIIAGDESAESELVERCRGVLRFLARRVARNDADAEDLFQETLILALEKIRNAEVREPERLAGFLRALVHNLGTQKYRRRVYDLEQPTGDEQADPVDDRRPDPLIGLLNRERVRLTRQVLAELDMPRDRDVLFRYYIAEDSSGAICRDLGIESDHFYRVLHRARQRYRRLWDEQVGCS